MKIRALYSERFHLKSGGSKRGLLSRFDSNKKLISILGDWIEKDHGKIESIASRVKEYFEKLDKFNFRDHVLAKEPYSFFGLALKSLGMILGLPLFLYGLINNYLIFKIPEYLSLTKIKDKQFRGSIAFVLAFVVLFPILYLIQTILVAVFTTGWWIPLLYLLSLVPAGLFAIHYSFWFKKLRAKWKFYLLSAKKDKDLSNLIELRKSIIQSLDDLTSESVSG